MSEAILSKFPLLSLKRSNKMSSPDEAPYCLNDSENNKTTTSLCSLIAKLKQDRADALSKKDEEIGYITRLMVHF